MDLDKIEKPKERLIAKLVANKKLTLDQVAEMKKDEVGKAVWYKELGNDLIEYVNNNAVRISKSDFLFPARDGQQISAKSLRLSLRGELKKAGMSLVDVGLAKVSGKTQFKTIDEVLGFLSK